MAFVLLIIGAVLLIAGVRNTADDGPNGPGLFSLLKNDFTGQQNFIFWVVSILLIGAIGYIPKLKPISTAMLALVVIVLVLNRGNSPLGGGLFAQFTSGLASTTTAAQAPSITVGNVINPGTPVPSGGVGSPAIFGGGSGGFVPATQPTLTQLGAGSYTGL